MLSYQMIKNLITASSDLNNGASLALPRGSKCDLDQG